MNTLIRGLILAVGAIVVGQVTDWIENRPSNRRRDTRRIGLAGFIIQAVLGVAAFFYVVRAYLGH